MSYGLTMRTRLLELPDDREAVLRFLQRAEAETGRHGLSENKKALVERDDGRPGTGILATEGDTIVAYVGLAPARAAGEWAMETVLGAGVTEPASAVEAAIETARRLGGHSLRWWAYDPDSQRFPPAHGFEPERDLLRMIRSLPTDDRSDFPGGITVAGLRPAVDEEALIAVNNAAFVHHHDNGAMTLDDLHRRMAMDWFDPDGVRMAWDGDTLAGFCWTKVHPGGEGEIYIIGAAPAYQGMGLGKALVTEGMRYLATLGCREVLLYTDADNERAVGLYEALGFVVDRVHRAFMRRL